MRLLATTGSMFARPLDWTFGVFAEAGFERAELMVTQDPVSQDAGRSAELARREGLTIDVVHGPFLLATRRVLGTDLIAKARRSLEIAEGVGASVMVVHPPLRWQGAYDHWLRTAADGEAGANGTRLGVENMFPLPFARREVRLHRYTHPGELEVFRHVVFDTSHFGVTGVDVLEAHARLASSIVHVHLSDHDGGTRDSHAAIGAGQLPLGTLIRRIGTEVTITLELDCRAYLGDRAGLVRFLASQRARALSLADDDPATTTLARE